MLAEHAWLGGAIDRDSEAGRFGAWGWSTAIDENTGAPVLSAALFAALHARAGIPARWPVGDAGVLHVYGYLLSTVPTPYGLKRARWMDGALARAYGLPDDEFVPWARSQTLLQRVGEAAEGLFDSGATRMNDVGGVEASVAWGRVPGDGPWAVAYRVDGRLVTTFPVASIDAILAEWDAEPARLRWNGVMLPGRADRRPRDSRSREDPPASR